MMLASLVLLPVTPAQAGGGHNNNDYAVSLPLPVQLRAVLAVSSTPSAFMTARVVLSVGLP